MSIRSFVAVAATAACIITPATASAGSTTCKAAPTAAHFSPWGDLNQYKPFPGAGFESGASGWSWGNKANIVSGDDAHMLSGDGSHAVNIPSTGTARSPWICVDSTMPSMRFFLRRVTRTGPLTVTGYPLDQLREEGHRRDNPVPRRRVDTSPPIVFPEAFMNEVAAGGLNTQFHFETPSGSSFRIDDIYLDPFKRT